MDYEQDGSVVDDHIGCLQWREQHHHSDFNQHHHESEPPASTACNRPYNTADHATNYPAHYSAYYAAKPRYVTNHAGQPGTAAD